MEIFVSEHDGYFLLCLFFPNVLFVLFLQSFVPFFFYDPEVKVGLGLRKYPPRRPWSEYHIKTPSKKPPLKIKRVCTVGRRSVFYVLHFSTPSPPSFTETPSVTQLNCPSPSEPRFKSIGKSSKHWNSFTKLKRLRVKNLRCMSRKRVTHDS